jgi:hypothetical protein
MQPRHIRPKLSRQLVITVVVVAFLTMVTMVPAAQAMSLAPAEELSDDEAVSSGNSESIRGEIGVQISIPLSALVGPTEFLTVSEIGFTEGTAGLPSVEPDDDEDRGPGNRPLSRAEMQFLEDNWYIDIGALVRDEEDVEEGSSSNPALTREEIQFLEDNWHLDAGTLIRDDDAADVGRSRPALTRDEIQFQEDNWHFDTGAPMVEDDAIGAESSNPSLTHDEIQFQEDNWHLGVTDTLYRPDIHGYGATGPLENGVDRADFPNERQNRADESDAGVGWTPGELPYPWVVTR